MCKRACAASHDCRIYLASGLAAAPRGNRLRGGRGPLVRRSCSARMAARSTCACCRQPSHTGTHKAERADVKLRVVEHCPDRISERENIPSEHKHQSMEWTHFFWRHKTRNPSSERASSSRYLKYSPYLTSAEPSGMLTLQGPSSSPRSGTGSHGHST